MPGTATYKYLLVTAEGFVEVQAGTKMIIAAATNGTSIAILDFINFNSSKVTACQRRPLHSDQIYVQPLL